MEPRNELRATSELCSPEVRDIARPQLSIDRIEVSLKPADLSGPERRLATGATSSVQRRAYESQRKNDNATIHTASIERGYQQYSPRSTITPEWSFLALLVKLMRLGTARLRSVAPLLPEWCRLRSRRAPDPPPPDQAVRVL